MVLLVIVDSLRYDHAPDLPGFTKRKCIASADNTEPAIATILTGRPPSVHGVTTTPTLDLADRLRRLDVLPKRFKTSYMMSPAIGFKPLFTRFKQAKYADEVEGLPPYDLNVVHVMDVHDYRDHGRGLKYYRGFEAYRGGWEPPTPRPMETALRVAALLRAMYRGAVERCFECLAPLIRAADKIGELVVVTADHGESLTYFHHHGAPDPSVYEVPLYANIDLEDRVYRQEEVYDIVLRARA